MDSIVLSGTGYFVSPDSVSTEEIILDHLSEQSIPVEEIKRLWLHQANINMNQSIAKNVFGCEPQKPFINITKI